ncbi:hypothetical protein K32_05480 [Kaistia sp. 32K]|nr:hypothetical protein K32_05480 [Kaistia sp. 32K]
MPERIGAGVNGKSAMTKKTYEAPVLVKREKLDRIAANSVVSGQKPV